MPGVTRLLICTALLLLTPSISNAQIGGGGSIQGTVVDVSKAALPGATVTATNIPTSIATVRQTSDAGVYALTPLPPGQYRVTVSLDGFQTFVRDGIVVDGFIVLKESPFARFQGRPLIVLKPQLPGVDDWH